MTDRVWTVGNANGYNPNTIYEGDNSIASVFGVPLHTTLKDVQADGMRWAEGLNNAYLIAAAPKLLAAAKAALADVEGYARTHGGERTARKRIEARATELRAAIDKAISG